MRGATPAAAMAGLLAACPGPTAPQSSSFDLTAPAVTGPAGSTGDAGSSSGSSIGQVPEDSSTGAASSSSGAPEPRRDVGGAPDLGDLHPAGCNGKIDILFMMSRDPNMDIYQSQLLDAFPKFIATIESKFADFDYHIMVVDGDDLWGQPNCTADDDCGSCPVPDYPCDLLDTVTECDVTWGAGTVFPSGFHSSNKPCDVAGGRRYLVKGQPNLAETFACVALVGSSGYWCIGQALAAAMQPEINGPGGCNEGFLRDDALLLVVFVAGAWEWNCDGKPKTYAQAVLDAKRGDPNAVVMLDFTALPGCHPQDVICDLKYYFPHFLLADIFAPDWGPAFVEATELVDTACSEFIPG